MYHVNDFAYNIKEMLDFLKKIRYDIHQNYKKDQKKCFFEKNVCYN